MNKEEQRLRDEISYLYNLQEFDKSNYDMITANFFQFLVMIISVIIGMSAIILSIEINDIFLSQFKFTLLFIVMLILLCFTNKRLEEFKNSRKKFSEDIQKRRKLIGEKYNKIYNLKKGFKEKLEEEIKEISL